MTAHGIVIAFLLLFPLVLVGVVVVGATSAAVKRSLEYLQILWRVSRRKRSIQSLPLRTHCSRPRPVL